MEEMMLTQENTQEMSQKSNQDLQQLSLDDGRHFVSAKVRAKAKSNLSMNAKRYNGMDPYRIESENIRLAGKLMNVKPSYDLKKFENQFNHHQYISINMRKIKKKKIPIHDGRLGQLPPLEIVTEN